MVRLSKQAELRPELQLAAQLRVDARLAKEYDSSDDKDTSILARLIRCSRLKLEGNDAFKSKQYERAVDFYKRAIHALVGDDFTVPITYGRCDKYDNFDFRERLDLTACANNIAQSYVKMGRFAEALDWLSEVEVVYKSELFASQPPQFEWMDARVGVEEWFTGLMKAHARASHIFLTLGNTGSAVWKAWQCTTVGSECDDNAALESISKSTNFAKICELRHPDPSLIDGFEVSQPVLQVKGIWKKANVTKSIPARYGACSFVWKNHLYICGGEKSVMELDGQLSDFWCIDLKNPQKWKRLPDFPFQGVCPDQKLGMGLKMAVFAEKAWLFMGSKRVFYYDLLQETWKEVVTKYRGVWPYPGNVLTEYCAHAYQDVLYVFGGKHDNGPLGCNLLMALNLKTFEWQHLGGTTYPKANYSVPNPRERPASWLRPDEEKIYILYGDADRVAARLARAPHAAQNMYCHDDFWSYSIPEKLWRREKIRGNSPCARTEFAAAYNPLLNKTIAFGGYHGSVPTAAPETGPEGTIFDFTYYADTYVLSDDGRWSQVVTRGFPTYRALMQMDVDGEGGIWLFGGHCPSQFVPSRQAISKTYGDLWQLRLDVPNGGFESTQIDEETDTKFGPYRRCFGCGNLGIWKKCGGSCGGKAFFCDTQCQREAWNDHRKLHDCHRTSAK